MKWSHALLILGRMKRLLTVTAVTEAATGLALIAMPSIFVRLLVGAPLHTYSAVVLGRIAGAALFALGVACWLARYDAKSSATRWLVSAMFIYNSCATVILGVAGIWSRPVGIGLWPAVVLHAAMTVWCVASLAAQAPIYDDNDRRAS